MLIHGNQDPNHKQLLAQGKDVNDMKAEGGYLPNQPTNPVYLLFTQSTKDGNFGREHKEDEWLCHCWYQVLVIEKEKQHIGGVLPSNYFLVRQGLLYFQNFLHSYAPTPHPFPLCGHLGVEKIREHFHWCGMVTEVKNFVQRCQQ